MGNARTKKANQEQEAMELPQIVDENLTCEICIEPIETPNNKFRNRDLCSHPYCLECVITYIRTKLDDNVSEIPCPDPDCTHILDTVFFRPLLPPQVFVKWCDLLCESTLLGLDRCYCPYNDCSALVVNECGGRVKKEKCPNCKRLFCFQCKKQWHGGFRCGVVTDENDVAFGVLAEQKEWKSCPRCFQFVERVTGCNAVTCRCNAYFCYKCGQLLDTPCDCMIELNNRMPRVQIFFITLYLVAILMSPIVGMIVLLAELILHHN